MEYAGAVRPRRMPGNTWNGSPHRFNEYSIKETSLRTLIICYMDVNWRTARA
jgi:hypothetical protein